jgi:hypothetical protein
LTNDLDDTTIANVDYGGVTGFSAGHPGKHDVTFIAWLPADVDDDDDDDETSTPVSGNVSYTFLPGTDYTMVAYGRLADIRTFLVEGFDQREAVDDDKLILQFTHSAPDTPEVDAYITAVQAGITTRQYVDTLAPAATNDITSTARRSSSCMPRIVAGGRCGTSMNESIRRTRLSRDCT